MKQTCKFLSLLLCGVLLLTLGVPPALAAEEGTAVITIGGVEMTVGGAETIYAVTDANGTVTVHSGGEGWMSHPLGTSS